MKRLVVLLLAVCFVLAGCGHKAPEPPASKVSVPEEEVTVERVKELFWQTADSNCTVQDCVLADDGAYGLLGVVQYSREDDFTHFAFVDSEGLWQTVGVGAVPSGEGGLEYLGDATVGVPLFDPEKGVASYTTIEYSDDGQGSVHFTASSEAVE